MVISAAARESEYRVKVPVVTTKDYEPEPVRKWFLLSLQGGDLNKTIRWELAKAGTLNGDGIWQL